MNITKENVIDLINDSARNKKELMKIARSGFGHIQLMLVADKDVMAAVGESLHLREKNFNQIIQEALNNRRYINLAEIIKHADIKIIKQNLEPLLSTSSASIKVALIEKGLSEEKLLHDTQPRVIASLIKAGHIFESMYQMPTKSIKMLLIEHGDHKRFYNDDLAMIRAYVITKKHIFTPFVNDSSYLVLARYIETVAKNPDHFAEHAKKLIKKHLKANSGLSKQVLNLALKYNIELELLTTCDDQVVSMLAQKKLSEMYSSKSNKMYINSSAQSGLYA